ncbi:MAG: phenylphosphate synthase subunit beta [Deltaproteobacteria bacterium]|nr:phenylphosphate synthase subunit beta [Deltaproteobacteria bacterium]
MGQGMTEARPLVCWFHECNRDSLPLVGGKNSSLGELINANIRVPPGFAVTTEAYRFFIDKGGIKGEIEQTLGGLNAEDSDSLNEASRHIRDLIEACPMPVVLEDYVADYYRKLSKICGLPAAPVAVRSSATAEDLPGASFAGQQDTFLWIRGVDKLLSHVAKCFSSLFTARAISYRIKMGFAHQDVALSVGVQKMANAFTAGVMFTLNPANGDRSMIVIDSNFGFGESVVSGEVTPDNFRVDKVTMEIVDKTISKKEVYYTLEPAEHCSAKMAMPEERQMAQSTIDKDILELARMGKLIEKHYGCPQDIEWAVDKDMPQTGRVFILQSRPETVWSCKTTAKPPETGKTRTAMDLILSSIMTGKKLS